MKPVKLHQCDHIIEKERSKPRLDLLPVDLRDKLLVYQNIPQFKKVPTYSEPTSKCM